MPEPPQFKAEAKRGDVVGRGIPSYGAIELLKLARTKSLTKV
jgi:hypothetical protein